MHRLVRYLSVVLKWRKLIFFNTLGFTALAVAVSLILPYRYTAVAQVLPPPEDDIFGMSTILGGGLSGGLSRLRSGMMGEPTPSDLMVGVLTSRTVMSRVVERCSIIQHYEYRKPSIEQALRQLGDMTSLSAADEGIVRIGVEAKTPVLAADIANCYVEELDAFLRNSNISRGKSTREFVERRLAEVESSLAVAKESLEVFQQRHHTVTVEDETRAAIDAYAKLKSQLYVKEAELGIVQNTWSPENPYVKTLKREIAAFRVQLRQLEAGGGKGGFGVGFAVPFEELPEVAAGYLTRYRDSRILEEAYAMLYQQYEYARIMEARDTPNITVLDLAVPPERKSSPKRRLIVTVVFIFSLAASVVFAFTSEYFGYIRVARPEEYRGWRALRTEASEVLRGLIHPSRSRTRH